MNRAGAFLVAYVTLIAALLFAAAVAHAATPPLIDIPSITVMENAGSAPVVIVKSKASSYSKVNIATVDGSAKAGIDYQPVSVTLTLANNATSAKLPVPIIDNATYQGPRSFLLKLTILRFGQAAPSMTPITVTITDDELPPPPPTSCPDGSTVPAGQACPTGGLPGEKAIADNFPFAAAVEPTWYGPAPTNRGGVPGPIALNDLGAFRIDCAPGQLLKDDPIVLPGQSGASHLHLFWGNTGTNANSTYQSLRTSGGTTCGSVQSAPVNRSAYWAPAMIVAPGMALKPDHILIYYKRFAASSPACSGPNARGICVDLPNGIRFVTGYNMKTMSGGPADFREGQWDYNFMGFACWGSADGTVGSGAATSVNYHTIADVVAAGCPVGARLHVSLAAPECWDGVNLDTADHRSHMAYATGLDFGDGRQCDANHPYLIPMMSVQLFYNTDANFTAGKWHLSSDEMVPGAVPGSTLHMDYWEAWSPTAKTLWMKNCINAPASCSGGDLGDGTDIIGGNEPWPAGWPKQVPVSAMP